MVTNRRCRTAALALILGAVLPACASSPEPPAESPPKGENVLPGGVVLPPLPDRGAEEPEVAVPDVGHLVGKECHLDPKEERLAELLRTSDLQQRSELECDAALSAFAEFRARDLIDREYFSHVTPGGVGPNALLRLAGYDLPSTYQGRRDNHVEALAAGFPDPADAWEALLDSSEHRKLLIAEHDFYRKQDRFGIARAYDDRPNRAMRDYWVVIIARQRDPDEPRAICTPSPSICYK